MVQVRKDTLHALEVVYTVSAIALYMYSVLVILGSGGIEKSHSCK